MTHITLENIGLSYPLYGHNARSLKSTLVNSLVGGRILDHCKLNHVMALENLSFKLEPGDRLALIGHNGSGKSSLLKLLSGVYEPTEGSISCKGKRASLLDIGMGLDQDASGYENIYLCGMIRGLSRAHIKTLIPEIVAFTELEGFLQLPVRTYSSGMMIRLAFAIATSVQPAILLLDEVAGVGDQAFFKRAKKRLDDLILKTEILVYASHHNDTLREFCNKVLWLDKGKMHRYGGLDILDEYETTRDSKAALTV